MNIVKFKSAPSIISSGTVVGKKEHEGPLETEFDIHDDTATFGMKTWEMSESEMQRLAFNIALAKKDMIPQDIDLIIAGDLMNQCTSSAYAFLEFKKPYIGIYGACSTFAEGIMLASMMINANHVQNCAVATSSHFCSAERQFRFPLEYGGQRTPTAQWTVTGAGAAIVSSDGAGPYVNDVFPGTPIDKGITDANNMGAAMAPAAVHSFSKYFDITKTIPSDYDLILTGDLGMEGHSIFCELMNSCGYDMHKNYNDCGLMIFNRSMQDVHAGGSGCGCSAVVFCAYVLQKMIRKELNNVLFASTGALMSPGSVKQGCSIPGIAHIIHLTNERQ